MIRLLENEEIGINGEWTKISKTSENVNGKSAEIRNEIFADNIETLSYSPNFFL